MSYIFAQGGRLGNTNGAGIDPAELERQGAVYTGRRPCFVWFRGELYVIGYYTRPLVRQKGDSNRYRLGGIRAPQLPLSATYGSGSGGSTGFCQVAITFLHKSGTRVLCESNFGNVVNMGQLTGTGRLWSDVDNLTAEARVTHVRGYASIDGTTFRMAWEAPYGLTTIEENVRTARLTFAGPENLVNSLPPPTYYGHSWAGRMWYARSSTYPYRIWWSKPGFGQYVAPASFRDTLDRETITGCWKGRNELLVFCANGTYMVRQFGAGVDDFVLEKLDSDVGCCSHFGIAEIHNRVWFPSDDGPWIYDGSFRHVGGEIQPLWRDDYNANKAAYQDGFAVHDRGSKVYMFFTRRSLRPEFENSGLRPGSFVWIGGYGNFEPSLAAEQPHPDWTLDMRHRFDSSAFYDSEGNLLIASCDGKIRKQDDGDADDDGDRLEKEAVIRSGHRLYDQPGDDLEGGKQLPQLWYYVESELSAWSLYVRGGDEQAWKSKLPDNDVDGFWKVDVAATLKTETREIRTERSGRKTLTLQYVPATVHYFVPERVSGRGFTFELRAVGPVGLKYRGFGGQWVPGATARGIEERTTILGTILVAGEELNPYEATTIDDGSQSVAVSLSYSYGSPAWPIAVRIVCAAASYDSSIELADPNLAGALSNITLVNGQDYELSLTVTDANGVSLDETVIGLIHCVAV
jgi:hypothetical protein